MAGADKKQVTPDITKNLADITGLDIGAERAAELAPQIQSMRESINAMGEIDLTDIEPATVFPLKEIKG